MEKLKLTSYNVLRLFYQHKRITVECGFSAKKPVPLLVEEADNPDKSGPAKIAI